MLQTILSNIDRQLDEVTVTLTYAEVKEIKEMLEDRRYLEMEHQNLKKSYLAEACHMWMVAKYRDGDNPGLYDPYSFEFPFDMEKLDRNGITVSEANEFVREQIAGYLAGQTNELTEYIAIDERISGSADLTEEATLLA